MAAYLLPALDAFARFLPDLPREHAQARMGHVGPPEEAVALVIEGDAVSDATGVIRTVDFLRDVTPPVAEDTVPAAIFVTGSLIAPDAILEEFDSDWSPMLKVFGNVTVRSAFLYGSASEIDGDLVAADTVFGFYNHGSLHVRGALRATLLLDSDYSWQVDGPVACRYVLGDLFRANFERTHPPEDTGKILVWDAVSDRDDFDHGFIWGALSRGDPILRPADLIGSEPQPQLGAQAEARLAPLRARHAAGEAITELDLSGCQLRFVPDDLRRFTGLRRLSLKDNNVRVLPDWLPALKGLEALDLRTCGLTRIPAGLDVLPVLRELYLDGNHIMQAPEHGGAPAALEYLSVGSPYCWDEAAEKVHRFTATLDLAAFPRLRAVEQVYGQVQIQYPSTARLWASPTLESLNLNFEIPGTVPEHLPEATGLRVLGINLDGEMAAASAAVLARMPGLQLLYLGIFSTLSREQCDLVCAAVPNAFVRHWCATPTLTPEQQTLYDTADRRREQGDPARIPEVDACLAGMEVRRCFERCDQLERLLGIRTVELLWSVLNTDLAGRPAAMRAAAEWGDGLSRQIPDLGEHLWRQPFTALGWIRALATLCAALRPALDGDHAAAAEGVAALRRTAERNFAHAPDYRKDDLRAWLDKASTLTS